MTEHSKCPYCGSETVNVSDTMNISGYWCDPDKRKAGDCGTHMVVHDNGGISFADHIEADAEVYAIHQCAGGKRIE